MIKKTTYEEEVKKIEMKPMFKLMITMTSIIMIAIFFLFCVLIVKLMWTATKFIWHLF